MTDKILVFIPMYNCEAQITRVIDQFTGEIQRYISEILIVDNGSSDNSLDTVSQAIKKLHVNVTICQNTMNYSLGGSHKVAFNYAKVNKFDYIITMHADDQGSISEMVEYIINRKHQDYDCILGARFMKKSKLIGYSSIRIIANFVFNVIATVTAHKKIYDLGSGLNMYSVASLQGDYYLKFPNSMLFNEYLLFYYVEKEMKILFVPITWREDDQISNVKLTKIAKELLQIFYRYIFQRKKMLYSSYHDEETINYTTKVIIRMEGIK